MRNQNRLGPLDVRVGRHGSRRRLFLRAASKCSANPPVQHAIRRSQPSHRAEVGRNLLIPAAPAVQFVAGFADQRDQLFLDKVVNVLRFIVSEESGILLRLLADLLETPAKFPINSSVDSTPACSAPARAHGLPPVRGATAAVERKRTLPAFEVRDPAAAGTGPTTSSFATSSWSQLRARPRRQSQNADEALRIFLVVAVAHGE